MKKYRFDHEDLDVYQLELQFIAWVTPLIDEVKTSAGSKVREVCNHLDRASLSALFNTAEGNGKRQSKMRGRFFDDARGSAAECAACLDALVAKGVCTGDRIDEGKALLYRIVSILSKLINRFAPATAVREGVIPYNSDDAIEDEYEDEHEDD
ncbi:MAG: four helix bundle protein [Desulfobacterales bacterium]|jgi:four helix bundle protein